MKITTLAPPSENTEKDTTTSSGVHGITKGAEFALLAQMLRAPKGPTVIMCQLVCGNLMNC